MDLFKDVINAIMQNKKDLFKDPEAEKVYNSFMVNRALSYHQDTLFIANQLNQLHQLDKSTQITLLLNTVRPRRREFVKWAKPIREGDLKAVMVYFGYSTAKAIDALKLLTDDQITSIKERINTGE